MSLWFKTVSCMEMTDKYILVVSDTEMSQVRRSAFPWNRKALYFLHLSFTIQGLSRFKLGVRKGKRKGNAKKEGKAPRIFNTF